MIELIGLTILLISLGASVVGTMFFDKEITMKNFQLSVLNTIVVTVGLVMMVFGSEGWLSTIFYVIIILMIGSIWFLAGERKQLTKRYLEITKERGEG